jgi:hypothetical protein
MDDGTPALRLPDLPAAVARPDRRARDALPWRTRAAGLVLVAHAIGFVALDRAMDLRLPSRTDSRRADDAVEIRFLPPDTAPPVAPSALPPVREPARAMAAQPPTAPPPQRKDGLSAQFLPATPEPSIETRRLFDPNGAVRWPEGFVDRGTPPPRDPMAPPTSPVPFERTRFDRSWKPDRETLAQQAVREVPLLGLLLPGAFAGPDCPPYATDPRCEGMAQEQRARIPPTPQSGKQPW